MDISSLAKASERFAVQNSPTILTSVGVVGTFTTAYLTGRAAVRATDKIRKVEAEAELSLETLEKIKVVWKDYVPPVAALSFTITAIILANRVGTKRAAAVAAAFAISQQTYTEYREKVLEKLGSRKEEELRAEIATERMVKNPPSQQIIITGAQVICFDEHSGRYFQCDMEQIRKAQNDVNYALNHNMYVPLTDFYDAIGLDRTAISDDIGWNLDKPLEVRFASVLAPDGRPALSIEYNIAPLTGFCRLQ